LASAPRGISRFHLLYEFFDADSHNLALDFAEARVSTMVNFDGLKGITKGIDQPLVGPVCRITIPRL
jgi:hypothetical protein